MGFSFDGGPEGGRERPVRGEDRPTSEHRNIVFGSQPPASVFGLGSGWTCELELDIGTSELELSADQPRTDCEHRNIGTHRTQNPEPSPHRAPRTQNPERGKREKTEQISGF